MLKKLRKQKMKKTIWIVLAVLILPAFVLWGSGGLRGKQDSLYAGKIFGRNISLLEFKDAVDAVRNQLIMRFGDNYLEIQKSLNIEELAWDRLIMLTEAKKRKISANDKEVVESIQSYPIFSRKDKFDEHIYLQMLQYVFRTPARLFEEQTRQSLILSKLYKKATDGLTLSDKEIEEEYRKLNEQISVYYIAALPSEFSKEINVNETELKDYFAKNELRFKQPPSFNIEYIYWSDEDGNLEEIKNKAETLLIKKADFLKNAKELGFQAKESGLFGQADPIPGIGWSPEILALLTKSKQGEMLPVIHADKYYYLIRLKEKKEAYIPGFEAIQEKVKETFLKEKAAELAEYKINDCYKKLAAYPKPLNFEKIAKDFGLKSGSTEFFVYGSYIEGVGMSDNFWLEASKLKEPGYSRVIEAVSGFYIIAPKAKKAMDEDKFAQEKKEFAEKLLAQKKQEYFTKFFEGLKTKARRF